MLKGGREAKLNAEGGREAKKFKNHCSRGLEPLLLRPF